MYLMTNLSRHPIYCGMTSDLVRRIYEHREGLIPNAYTTRYRITRLVYYEAHGDMHAAFQREQNVKHYSWKWKADLIESMNPEWEDLWDQIVKSPF
jgi:putative endonuclease